MARDMRGDSRMVKGDVMNKILFESDDPVWDDVVVLAAVAAGQAYRYFRQYVELDDLRQVAAEWALKRQDKVREYLFEESDDGWIRRSNKDYARQGETALITWMRRHCVTHARSEKAKFLGFEVGDEYFYTEVMVEGLIKVWGTGDHSLANQIFDQTDMGGKRHKRLANEGNELLAMVSDVGAAMRSLELRDYSVLMFRYCEGQTLQQIADFMDISPQRVEQLSQRGVRKLINYLGGSR